MTRYELETVAQAIDLAVTLGAPGISQITRQAIIHHATVRLRHQFNVPMPVLSHSPPMRVEDSK